MATKVTMKTIAEVVGTSVGTVDRVLNNRGRVNSEMKAKILKAANELSYQPDLSARKLRKDSLFSILIVIQKSPEYFCYALQRGIMDALNELKTFGIEGDFVYTDTMTKEETASLLLKMDISSFSAILIDPVFPELEEFIRRVHKTKKAVFTLYRDCEYEQRDVHVGPASQQTGMLAGDFLNAVCGGNAVAIITDSTGGLQSSLQRKGFLKVCNENASKVELLDVVMEAPTGVSLSERLTALLAAHPNISGIFLNTDFEFLKFNDRLLSLIREKQISILCSGINETVLTMLTEQIAQATVYDRPYQQGYQSIISLVQWLATQMDFGEKCSEILVQPELIFRHSIPGMMLPDGNQELLSGDYSVEDDF